MGNSQHTPIRIGIRAQICGGPLSGGVIAGIALVVGGSLLFIDNLGIFPITLTDAFWPIIMLLLSAVGLYRTNSLAVKILCGTGVIASVLLILGAFHVIRVTSDIIWPLVMIAVGIVLLIYRLRWPAFSDRMNLGASSKTRLSENRLSEAAVFSAVKRRVEAANFEGGELNTVFGSVEVDLRWSNIATPNHAAAIEANAVFGGIEIRIPETWNLSLQGSAIFGAYEDKTIPPRPEPGVVLPTLIIRGGTAFGSVVIRN
jgi:predicted membrane protein